LLNLNNRNYLKPIPASATVGANTDFAFDATNLTAIVGGVVVSNHGFGYTLSTSDDADTIAKRQFSVGFQGGFDGVAPTVKPLKAGEINPNTTRSVWCW
jgi:hypothetical protein